MLKNDNDKMSPELNDNDKMSPELSPVSTSKKSGVRRVNNVPMYILLGVLCLFFLIILMVASNRAAKQNLPNESKKKQDQVNNTSIFANEILEDANNQTNWIIPVDDPIPTLTIDEPQKDIPITSPVNLDLPPVPSDKPQLERYNEEKDDEAERIHMAKLQMLEEAIKSKTSVQVIAPRSNSDRTASNYPQSRQEMINELARVRQQIASNSYYDQNSSYEQKLAKIKSDIRNNNLSENDDNDYSQFDKKSDGGDRWQLEEKIQIPRSPYELRAGFIIPATLISGISSGLPGQIVAQVSQNVSDTATGRYLLIPQGSRLIGTYSSNINYGQERMLVAWQRIIFPDGKALDIGSMPGADAAGYSGFSDRINNHYLRTFGSALLVSGVTAGVTLSQDNNNKDNNKQRASDALSEALGQELGQVIVEMIRKNINIAPTLEIRPGYRFNVIVIKDITFSKPYKSFDY